MYCRNCGKAIAAQAELCMGCGVRPPRGDKFCGSCGVEVSPLAEMCVKCGAKLGKRVSKGKSKIASVLLAVFLSYWTWLYTYGKDAKKFWVCLVINSAAMVLLNVANSPSFPPSDRVGTIAITAIIQLGIYVWAIVAAAHRSSEWYENYPNI